MSEPSAGTASKVTIRSMEGGFILSWEEPDLSAHNPAMAQAMSGGYVTPTRIRERLCGSIEALLEAVRKTLRVTP